MDEWAGPLDLASNRAAIERVAVALGLANIIFLIRRSLLNYPFGIAMVTLYAWIFAQEKLYSDALLQGFFFVIQIYGWMNWRKARDEDGLARIVRARREESVGYLMTAIAGTLVLGGAMAQFTDAAFPFWDASIAIFSVIAQIMMARRKLENWIVWIIVDALAIGLYWTKGLHPTALLYAAFLVLSAAGYRSWRRAMRRADGNAA
jgi:nicotinamide mononucleotide transporter